MLFLGEISFSMYLLHFIILGSFSSFIFSKLEPHLPYGGAFLSVFAVSVVLILALSYLAYLYVDKKAAAVSRSIYDYAFKR